MTTARPQPTRTHDPQVRRLVIAFVGLAVVWGVAFNATALPFFPVVVAGGVLTGLVGLWVRRAGDEDTPGLALDARTAGIALVAAGAHYVVGLGLFEIASRLLPALTATALEVYQRSDGLPLWARLLLGAGVTAALEEVFWRGAFTPVVAEKVGRRLPADMPSWTRGLVMVLVSTAGYALFHVATLKVALIAAAALGGLVWGALLLATRSLGATMLAHMVWTGLMLTFPPSL